MRKRGMTIEDMHSLVDSTMKTYIYLFEIFQRFLEIVATLLAPCCPFELCIRFLSDIHSLAHVVEDISMIDGEKVRGGLRVRELVVEKNKVVINFRPNDSFVCSRIVQLEHIFAEGRHQGRRYYNITRPDDAPSKTSIASLWYSRSFHIDVVKTLPCNNILTCQ